MSPTRKIGIVREVNPMGRLKQLISQLKGYSNNEEIRNAIEEQERRMKEFDEKIKKITELRDSDPVLGQIAGLALMAQTMTEM